jgi:hypothetical protein
MLRQVFGPATCRAELVWGDRRGAVTREPKGRSAKVQIGRRSVPRGLTKRGTKYETSAHRFSRVPRSCSSSGGRHARCSANGCAIRHHARSRRMRDRLPSRTLRRMSTKRWLLWLSSLRLRLWVSPLWLLRSPVLVARRSARLRLSKPEAATFLRPPPRSWSRSAEGCSPAERGPAISRGFRADVRAARVLTQQKAEFRRREADALRTHFADLRGQNRTAATQTSPLDPLRDIKRLSGARSDRRSHAQPHHRRQR